MTVLNRAWLVATGLAAAVAFPAAPIVAQTLAKPPGGSPGTTTSSSADAARAAALLRESRQALDAKNNALAVEKFQAAAAASGGLAEMREPLMQAGRALVAAGVDPQQLRPPAANPAFAIPPGSAASAAATPAGGTGSLEARKVEASRLVAQGRAALERGDHAAALQIARRADALGVPDTMFNPGEPRVWQLLLDAESAARRSGVIPAGGVMPPSGVMQAGGAPGASLETAGEKVRPVQGSASLELPPAGESAANSGRGAQLYAEGIEALAAGDRAAARGKFLEAWRFEAELTPEVRQQLKDKLTLLQPEAMAPAPGGAPLTPLEAVDQQQQLERQRLYREISNELSEAQKISTSHPTEALDRINRLLRRVLESKSDEAFRQQMASIVQRAQAEQQKYVEENRASIELQLRNEQIESDLENGRVQRSASNDKIAELVDTFDQYMEERRYPEAEVVAKQVAVLAPDSEISVQMLSRSRMALRLLMNEEIAASKEETFADYLLDVERSASMPDPALPMHMPEARVWEAMSARRLDQLAQRSGLSESEERIRQRLQTTVDVRFPNRPLGEVLQTLGTVAGVPIYIDQQAVAEARVNLDEPVTLDLQQPIMLKSALQLLLDRYDLTWMIQDEVLKITSPTRKRGNLVPVPYKVADLVIPIPNFVSGYDDGLAGALRAAYQMTAQSTDVHISPMSTMDLAASRSGASGEMNPHTLAQYGSGGYPMAGANGVMGKNGRGAGAIADFDSLMELIETTIEPDTWEALGGPSTMAPYQANLSLVISTTTDVHEQIADLLESLRRLQNLQVTIEVRFITLSDSFYERIGVDFDFAIDDNVATIPPEDRGPSVTVGLSNQNRVLTSDLDIQFNQGSFGPTAPTFGGYSPGQGAQVGFAILSDIEAFFFLEAAQGDSRSNVLQAPKVTLFDGQMASINDTTSRPFVTSIIPVVGDFAVAQQPVIVVLNEGTQLNVQAVVSDDKRFVRLTLVPMFTQINDVDTFTFEGSRRRRTSSEVIDPETGEPIEEDEEEEIIQGTTVQQPSFSQTSVSTTVSVPDGGTILLGGIKRLREQRNEVGVPMLSKIPYVNRLFRNVGIGREATSLMLMVTPRIIIQEEEELAQTGFDPTR
ncbi:general secretion pathway protein GspD [Candidatus Laterigemmans baculatus]|uniref:general secretion pathway protein GspD n=1 Tax=Candidatus Laterigemmans baculatus TaxID=2770505 RepID=UPI001F39537D|nr:general secretion pathway protein GspD [Candidatus Laterigemmans baculatus]